MVTMQSADKALKTLYLGVISEQLNTNINPFLAKIKQSSNDVWGKEIRKLAQYGINGGIGAGTEDGALPIASGNNYEQFVLNLKNLYGTIELTDKAIRASENSAGAFVNLLNSEMEGLIKASKFNFGRMLFGDGSGVLAKGAAPSTPGYTVKLKDTKNLAEGMVVDFYTKNHVKMAMLDGQKILAVNRATNEITIGGEFLQAEFDVDYYITMQGSKDKELTGLGAIFGNSATLYGINRATNRWLSPKKVPTVGAISENVIQKAIDELDENTGSKINYILCSSGVKRAFQNHLATYKRNIDIMDLQGGFKAISYNGIPLVSDRFCPNGNMYLLNSDDFTIHQLCDWKWLEGEDGKVIKQVPGKPVYTASLVKYADLLCDKPSGQALLEGITEA